MVTRIVKLSIKPEYKKEFIALFLNYRNKISLSKGCISVELLQEEKAGNTFFTYSKWDSSQALENYRNSKLFAEIWPTVKRLFNAKAQAWTVENLSN